VHRFGDHETRPLESPAPGLLCLHDSR